MVDAEVFVDRRQDVVRGVLQIDGVFAVAVGLTEDLAHRHVSAADEDRHRTGIVVAANATVFEFRFSAIRVESVAWASSPMLPVVVKKSGGTPEPQKWRRA